MKIGYMVGEGTGAAPDVAALVELGQRIEAAGLDTAWIAEIFLDAATAAAALGMVTERIEIGTGVIPTPMRHPYALAHQAATAQQACGGRFTLGIGLSHKMMVENVLGLSYDRPLLKMREYLEVLNPMLRGEAVDHAGELYTARFGPMELGTPVSVLVAALGPQMLRLAGRLSGGTVTWAAGLKTLESHIVPTICRAAEEAGRAAPRIVAGLPVVVTSDLDAAREKAVAIFGHYRTLPSYRAMMDREGVDGIEDLIVAGDEASVRAQLARIEATGTTDLCVFPYGVDDGSVERTIDLLGDVAGGS
jgi:F420-dependent oxidoreductase-like protein